MVKLYFHIKAHTYMQRLTLKVATLYFHLNISSLSIFIWLKFFISCTDAYSPYRWITLYQASMDLIIRVLNVFMWLSIFWFILMHHVCKAIEATNVNGLQKYQWITHIQCDCPSENQWFIRTFKFPKSAIYNYS